MYFPTFSLSGGFKLSHHVLYIGVDEKVVECAHFTS